MDHIGTIRASSGHHQVLTEHCNHPSPGADLTQSALPFAM
jgi:hypothetical protein